MFKKVMGLMLLAIMITFGVVHFGPNIQTDNQIPSSIQNPTNELHSVTDEESYKIRDERKQNVIEMMRIKFAPSIDNKHTQVKAIEKLVAYLKKEFPDSWRMELEKYLIDVFPDLFDEMMQLFINLENYNEWFQSERQVLSELSPEEKRKLIWEMRKNFLGEDALEIWAEALKSEKIADTLTEINSSNHMNIDESIDYYLSSLQEVYQEELESVLNSRGQEMTDRLLSLESIQNDLREMDTQQRLSTLTNIRRNMGMDEAAIERWNDLDIQRDERRKVGEEYMSRKESLTSNLEGDELHSALFELQNELFGSEAEIIRNEEAGGYERFSEPQMIGKN